MFSIGFAYIILGITAVVSFMAFSNNELLNKTLFIPVNIDGRNEYWRFITHGFIHADMNHLLFNGLTLYFFGPIVESYFGGMFGNKWMFPLFYLLGLVLSSLPSYFQHKANPSYRALGASGAISAVLFSFIALNPWEKIYIFFAIPVPGILFGVLYLWYSAHMSKQNQDNIGHDAHFWGGVFGFIFPFVMKPGMIDIFLDKINDIPFLR